MDPITTRLQRGEITPAQAIRLSAAARRAGTSRPAHGELDRQERIGAVYAEIDALTGLASVKRAIREIGALAEVNRRRLQEGLAAESQGLHMVFTGNPGTGKTTVARLLARLFKEMGILSRGHLVEVERADLVGEYIGHTAQKTRETITRATGGVLFIDEAYSLARGGEKDFGKESIDCLVKALEDRRSDLMIILAGYPDEMDWFLAQNPGLHSRFPLRIHFPDYEPQDLVQIAQQMFRARQYSPVPAALAYLRLLLTASPEGNGRAVRNLVEASIRAQAVRLMERGIDAPLSREDLMAITREDLEAAFLNGAPAS